jgi:hypothetical protein
MKKWSGLIEIEEITKKDKNNNILFVKKNIKNIMHNTAENLLLSSCFSDFTVPDIYYFGLDARENLSLTGGENDESLIYPVVESNVTIYDCPKNEPNNNGYARASINKNAFTILKAENNHYKVKSPTINFTGLGSGWGPVTNLFMSYLDEDLNTIIISTVPLEETIFVKNNESIYVKMNLILKS